MMFGIPTDLLGDSMNANTERGIEARYDVKKINDPTGKHDDCHYFVLDPQHDETAREALRWYAANTPHRALRRDLHEWLDDLA